jgi:predicted TIM-barrel fold metal-dependent hydrolase
MANLRVVSADSHVMEPADLWSARLDKKFRDRSPVVVQNPKKPGYIFVAEGLDPFPVAGGFGAGRSGEELKDHLSKGYEAARPSGWDPVERIKDQEIDGVEAEVLYTTLGMPLFGLQDPELQRSCFRVYNDWVAEYCAHNPKRLYGVGLVSLEDIDMGTKELERLHKQGMRGAMIWGHRTTNLTAAPCTTRSGRRRKKCKCPSRFTSSLARARRARSTSTKSARSTWR